MLSLDHVGLIVRDLAVGAKRWEDLGFKLSAISPQMGLKNSGNKTEEAAARKTEFVPWATANRCAVFETGYIELIGVHRPECFNPWEKFLERFQGAHLIALRCSNADDTFSKIKNRTDDFDPPVARRRDAPFGTGTREMRFRNIFSRDQRVCEGRYIIIEHQTPEVLWQSELLDHPNGALGLRTLTICSENPEPIAKRLTAVSGCEWTQLNGGQILEFGGGGFVELITFESAQQRYPKASLPPLPAVISYSVTVKSTENARSWLDHRGISHLPHGNGFWVKPEENNGCILEFTERPRN